MLVVLINNASKCVIVCHLCFNFKCVFVLGSGSEHLWANLYKANMAANETKRGVDEGTYIPQSARWPPQSVLNLITLLI